MEIDEVDFTEFLEYEIEIAKKNINILPINSFDDKPYDIGDVKGYTITKEQLYTLCDEQNIWYECLNKIPKVSFKKVSSLIREEMDIYNNNLCINIGHQYKEYRQKLNPSKVRNKIKNKIKSLQEDMENLEDVKRLKGLPQLKKEMENQDYYKLYNLLSKFYNSLSVTDNNYNPLQEDTNELMGLPFYKYFAPKKTAKTNLHELFKNINIEFDLACVKKFKNLVDSL